MSIEENQITEQELNSQHPVVKAGLSQMNLNNPAQVMEFAKILKRFITENNLSVPIQGNEYAMVDAWKYAGLNFGITAVPYEPERIDAGKIIYYLWEKYVDKYKNERERVYFASTNMDLIEQARMRKIPHRESIAEFYNYKCNADIISISSGAKIGFGSATCSTAELKKVGFDEYAVASTAQTRAIGKAYRNLIGFIMKAAGFEPVPAEEMDEKYADKKEEGKNVWNEEVQKIIDAAQTTQDLADIWDEHTHLHSNKDFISAMTKAKERVPDPKNTKK